jgi:hypothetical protein
MSEWTEGVCEDGAAILRDGQPVPIAELLAHLNRCEVLKAQVELLRECNENADQALRSSMSVAEREGAQTNWPPYRAMLRHALDTYYTARQALQAMPVTTFYPKSN